MAYRISDFYGDSKAIVPNPAPERRLAIEHLANVGNMANGVAKVAAIMPTFNSELYIVEALRSILSQSFSKFTLFILDGGSTDATLEICEHFKKRDRRIQIAQFPNASPTTRVNHVFTDTDFDFYLMAHSDDVSLPHRFETQIALMEASSELIISGSSVHFWLHEKLEPQAHAHDSGFLCFPLIHDEITARLPFWWCFSTPSLIANGKTMRSRDMYFDETFKIAPEWWFYWRAAHIGKVTNLAEPLVSYRQHYSSHGPTNRDLIAREAREIRLLIAEEIGLTEFLTEGGLAQFIDLVVEYDRIISPPVSDDLRKLLQEISRFSPKGIDQAAWTANIESMALRIASSS